MSSYNNKISNPISLPNISNNSSIQQTNIGFNSSSNAIQKKKKLISTKALVIFGVSVIVLAGILTLIIVLVTRKKSSKRPNISYSQPLVETTDIVTQSVSTTDYEESIPIIDYNEAEKIINYEKTKETHELLKNSSNQLEELIQTVKNQSANISMFNITIGELPENLDFLKNASDNSLLVAKQDLDLYMESFSAIPEQINNLTLEMTKVMKNVSDSLVEYKNDIDSMNQQFEQNVRYLAMPLLDKSNKQSNLKRELSTLEENYKKEIEKLMDCYKKDVENQDNIIKAYFGAIKYNFETLGFLANIAKHTLFAAGTKLASVAFSTLHNDLLELKNLLIQYHNDLDVIINELKEMGQEIMDFASSLSDEEADIIENLKNLVLQFGDNFKDAAVPAIRILLSMRDGSSFKSKIILGIAIYTMEFIVSRWNIYEIKATTSLDLLFIVDITGSMRPYLEEIKEKIIEIIDGIVISCPGININLGFIGYRDFYEDYIDIDFTEDYVSLKDTIFKVYTSGGKHYYPDEDLAFALELALNKSWISNAKLVVLVADAPGHGVKYGGHKVDSYFPKRREMDEMILEMFGKGISLFCLNITRKTDIMFEVFQDIYNKANPSNANFQIIDNQKITSFPDTVRNYAIKVYTEQRDSAEQNCLLNKKTAVEILKSKYNIDNDDPDDNLRFILGPCNPVLLVPGVYATKLKVELNCKGLANDEKDTTLKDIRLYCGYSVCRDETNPKEEHSLLFAFLDNVFGIDITNKKNYGSCLGHISNYFQNEEECPKVNDKSICHYSKYVKVAYYGGTTDTMKESRCGVEGITNVVQTGGSLIDSMLSTFLVKAAGSFYAISNNLIDKGLKEGFSLGAIPNDYRRYLATNNFASKVFKYQIDRLYENTGKPVVIIAHSYGTLLTLTNLLLNENDKEFLKKIKKFIAMAPPFAGSTKLLDVFLHGNTGFDSPFTNYPLFGQYLQYKSLPTTMELRPLSIAASIFTEPEYKELGDAIKGRLEIERDCYDVDCDINDIKQKTEKFDEIFNGYFPSLLDEECAFESNIKGDEESFGRKCYTNIYNVGECPTIITKTVQKDTKTTKENFENNLCNKYGTNIFYQGECNDSRRNCLDRMYYSDKCPNPFSDKKAVKFLINRFNGDSKLKKAYGSIDETYFDDYETIKSGIKKSIEHQNEIDKKKELPVPPVDTELLYGSFYKTISVLVLNDNDFTKKGETFEKGGDDTVQTWSSLLTGLKWIYDVKKNNLTQKIKLIEYCSRLGKTGKYKFNQNQQQTFSALTCECLNDKNEYKNIEGCSHSTMLKDRYLIEYLYSIINKGENINYEINEKKEAVNKYNKNFDYTKKCNEDIYTYLNRVK